MKKTSSCDVRVHAYKNGKTMEQCREEAKKNTEILSHEILEKGEVSWTKVPGSEQITMNWSTNQL